MKELASTFGSEIGFSWVEGTRVAFSAPHAVTHFRDGSAKRSEDSTDLLALSLATQLRGSAIWTREGLIGDPNWDRLHPYKERLKALAKESTVIDLHIMQDRGFDVCLGLGNIGRIPRFLWMRAAEVFLAEGMTVSLNYPFSAGLRTVTGAMQTSGTDAIQVEMTWESMTSQSHGDKTLRALLELGTAIRDSQPDPLRP